MSPLRVASRLLARRFRGAMAAVNAAAESTLRALLCPLLPPHPGVCEWHRRFVSTCCPSLLAGSRPFPSATTSCTRMCGGWRTWSTHDVTLLLSYSSPSGAHWARGVGARGKIVFCFLHTSRLRTSWTILNADLKSPSNLVQSPPHAPRMMVLRDDG